MFTLTHHSIDPAELVKQLAASRSGGYVSFEGWVRDRNDDRDVRALEYQAYEPLAVKEGERILAEARERFGIEQALIVHRLGWLELNDIAVYVGVTAVHRGPAFDACRYLIDELKVRVPIWKKEHYVDGDSGWVACEHCARAGDHHHHHH